MIIAIDFILLLLFIMTIIGIFVFNIACDTLNSYQLLCKKYCASELKLIASPKKLMTENERNAHPVQRLNVLIINYVLLLRGFSI